MINFIDRLYVRVICSFYDEAEPISVEDEEVISSIYPLSLN